MREYFYACRILKPLLPAMYDICHCNCVHYTLHTEYSILHVCVYVYMCMYTCMYVYMCVCMYVCMYVRVHVCMYVCMYACMYVFIHSHITEIYIAPLQVTTQKRSRPLHG